MAEVIKKSVFTANGKECPVPSSIQDSLDNSGTPILGSSTETTEELQTKKDAENATSNWGSDVPATPEDVTQYSIDKYFGKNWKGAFPPCETIAQRKGSTILTNFAYYASLIDYIMQTLGIGSLQELLSAAIPSEVMKMYSHWIDLSNDWMNISMCIKNFKDFQFCTENPMAILNSTDAVLQNLEQTVLAIDGGIDHLMSSYNDISKLFTGGTSKSLESAIEQLQQKFGGAIGKIAENLSKMPESVMNAFLNCQFVQNMFSLPQRIWAHCAAIWGIWTSIKSPTCLLDFVNIIRSLRASVAEMKNAVAEIQSAIAQVQSIKDAIAKGNWIGVLGQLNQGSGMRGQAFNIIEHPSSFAAKYPHNASYRTPGGHIIEMDNTKNHERIHLQHKKGTSFEISPKGDLHSKVKKDFQLMVDGNIEINSNKKVTITGKEGVKIDFGGTTFQMDKSSMGMGGKNGKVTVDDYMLTAQKARIMSSENLTLGSVKETSVSAQGLLSLSSQKAIKIQAPEIIMISDGAGGIHFESTVGTWVAKVNGLDFISTQNTIINSMKTGTFKSSSSNMIEAGINIIGKG